MTMSETMSLSTASTRASMGYAGGGIKSNFAKTKLGKKLLGKKKKNNKDGDEDLDELLEAILSADWNHVREYLNTKDGKAEFKKYLDFMGYDVNLHMSGSVSSKLSGLSETNPYQEITRITRPSPSQLHILTGSSSQVTVTSYTSDAGETQASSGTPPKRERNPLHNKSTPTLLHLVCTLNPPVQLVEKIVWAKPEMVNLLNVYNQTALHLAATWGACPDVIICLLCQNPLNLASTRDVRMKTPLHLACEYGPHQYKLCGGAEGYEDDQEALCQVVESLAKYYPEAAKMDDLDGMTPLDYALKHGADKATIAVLRKLSE